MAPVIRERCFLGVDYIHRFRYGVPFTPSIAVLEAGTVNLVIDRRPKDISILKYPAQPRNFQKSIDEARKVLYKNIPFSSPSQQFRTLKIAFPPTSRSYCLINRLTSLFICRLSLTLSLTLLYIFLQLHD
jgi:hypothetical protein